jgi:toxin FitB
MKKYLLDTNVISELRKLKPHGAVLAWLRDLREEQIFLSAVTVGELQAGVELTRQQDPTKAGEIETWVDQLADSYQVLPMDTLCFREWARLMTGKPEQLMEDGMIAATARVHALTVATRNVRDFQQLKVAVLNPFQPE